MKAPNFIKEKKEAPKDEKAETKATQNEEADSGTEGRINNFNKGKRNGQKVKDPFKLAGAINKLKKDRGCK